MRTTFLSLLAISIAAAFQPQPLFALLNQPASQRAERVYPNRTRYEISVQIDPQLRSYKGHEKITFVNNQTKTTNYLLLFAYPNDPSIAGSDKKYLTISNVKANDGPARVEESKPFFRVYLSKELLPGSKITLDFDFSASVPEKSGSKDLFSEALEELMTLFAGSPQSTERDYGIFSFSKEILNLGLWYPALSKYDQEGWDEEEYAGIGDVSYFDPADFDVQITAPLMYRIVTTGSLIKRTPQKDGRVQHQIQSKMTRDFVVELSSKYEERVRSRNLTLIRSYFLPEHEKSGDIVMDAAVRAFDYYEKIFGPYPYTELDVVEAPLYGGAGGVEFPGLVTISSMLYRNPTDSEQEDLFQELIANNPVFDQLLEFVVAHEVAHQWWNAVVGSNSKENPFIDESMANYSAVLYFENFYGREAAEKQMAMQMKLNYQLHRLMGGEDRVVERPASSFEGPLEYSAIVYGKGALFFDSLRSLTGDRIFFNALRKYYDAFWFRIARPRDFLEIAQKESPEKRDQIEALFTRWIREKHGDEDIGPGTFEALMKTVLSGSPSSQSPERDQLMKELQELLDGTNVDQP